MNSDSDQDSTLSRVMRSHLIKLSTLGKTLDDETKWRPAWSSHALEHAVKLMLAEPGASHSVILRAVWDLMNSSQIPLDRDVANFVSDLVQTCFLLDRRGYTRERHDWIRRELGRSATPAQAYLALRALPEYELVLCQREIVAALEGSDFLEEASRTMAAALSED